MGKRETGPSCGQEAGEEGGEAWDVPPQLGVFAKLRPSRLALAGLRLVLVPTSPATHPTSYDSSLTLPRQTGGAWCGLDY